MELLFLKKNRKSFGQFAKKFYRCTRKRKTTTVRWMRGLVNGLQNRVHPFESGTHLKRKRMQQHLVDASFFRGFLSCLLLSTFVECDCHIRLVCAQKSLLGEALSFPLQRVPSLHEYDAAQVFVEAEPYPHAYDAESHGYAQTPGYAHRY